MPRFGIAQERGVVTSPYGEKENSAAVVLLALALVPRRCIGNGVLLPGVAAEPNEREEIAVGEAVESPEPPPVGGAWIGIVATCQLCATNVPISFKKTIECLSQA